MYPCSRKAGPVGFAGGFDSRPRTQRRMVSARAPVPHPSSPCYQPFKQVSAPTQIRVRVCERIGRAGFVHCVMHFLRHVVVNISCSSTTAVPLVTTHYTYHALRESPCSLPCHALPWPRRDQLLMLFLDCGVVTHILLFLIIGDYARVSSNNATFFLSD